MKGVVLAGGSGKRLRPLTLVTNKHLLPVHKKPMIYYPLETLVNAGISDILIITGGEHIGHFFRLLGSGKRWNARFTYEIQDGSDGTGAALRLAEEFVGDQPFMVVLGDNVISENVRGFVDKFLVNTATYKASILVAHVDNPQQYGVVSFEEDRIVKITEKPDVPESNCVNTGLWMFLPEVFELLKTTTKSPRGEYEATDILDYYASTGQLSYSLLTGAWSDAGSFDSLYRATTLMREREESAEASLR